MYLFSKQKLYKYLLGLIIGILTFCVGGNNKVHAALLKVERIPNIYVATWGGDKEPLFGQYGIFEINDKVVYCVEPGVEIITDNYNGDAGWGNSPYNDTINDKIQLIGYYGYNYPGHGTLRYRMATQALIWEATRGQSVEFWTQPFGNGDFINIDFERTEIMKLVNMHYTKPSFDSKDLNIPIGQETSLLDKNNVLANYEIVSSTGNSAKIDGNQLKITPTKAGKITISLIKKTYTADPTTIFVGIDPRSQKMGFFGLNNQVTSEVIVNSYAGKVTVEKLDADHLSITPQGDGILEGAVYGIYQLDGKRCGEVVIGVSSKGVSDFLPKLGKYYLLEEKSSRGYTLDPTKYYFEITAENLYPHVYVYEKIIERTMELYKVYADGRTGILKAEPNVSFAFYLKSNMTLYAVKTTDEEGRIKIKLPYGTYIVKQLTTTPGYEKVQDFEIVVDKEDSKPITKIISNAKISARLRVIKIDSESKKVIARDGIKFKIKNLDTNEYVCQNISYPTTKKVCVFETSKGSFITPYVLESGHYQIEELENQNVNGYLWNNVPLKFTIDENSNFIYDDDLGIILEVYFENEPVWGEVEVKKIGEKLVIDNNSYYYEEINLDGVTFELYAAKNIYAPDGTLIYKAHQLIDTFVTKDGLIKINHLYLGDYYLVETITANNHVLDPEYHYFTLSYQDPYSKTVSLSITLKNYLEKGRLEFTKQDLVTGNPLPNTTIQIYKYDDNILEAVLIFEGITDSEGKIIIDNLLVGKYYLIETNAPEGYILNPEKMFFEIEKNGDIVKANMKNEKEFDVPNTYVEHLDITNILSLTGFCSGIGLLTYGKKKKK